MSSCNCSCLHKHKSESRTCFLDLTKTQKYSQKTSCSMWLDAALAQHHLAATVTSTRGFTPLTGTDKQATSFLLIQDSNSFVQLKGPYPTSHTQKTQSQPWGHSSRRKHSYAKSKFEQRYLCTAHLAPASEQPKHSSQTLPPAQDRHRHTPEDSRIPLGCCWERREGLIAGAKTPRGFVPSALPWARASPAKEVINTLRRTAVDSITALLCISLININCHWLSGKWISTSNIPMFVRDTEPAENSQSCLARHKELPR